jgi:hypothetical protein
VLSPQDIPPVVISPSYIFGTIAGLAISWQLYRFINGAVRKSIVGDIAIGDIMTTKKCLSMQTDCAKDRMAESRNLSDRIDAVVRNAEAQNETLNDIKAIVVKIAKANKDIDDKEIDAITDSFIRGR